MKIKGVVFDFNGTLFWDTHLQNDSWDRFLEKYHFSLSAEEKKKYIHGINAKDTFEYLFKRELDDSEVHRLTEEKEVIYRSMCLEHGMQLAPGAEQLIRFLTESGIALAIATASAKNNVDFFIQHFPLLNYFKREHIIYNDGVMRGKPHPDLFNKAIAAIETKAEETLIFEDSHAGVESAIRSGAGKVIIVNSAKAVYDGFSCQQITHFDEVDRDLFV
ncbi:HAD family phosphatase [Draconibacterium sp. IB214405]|uniref:HAD family hydrolase n=1 Tax=Draconibacterium sp. IB214405 TaxID=3097352 RepID=UPI002A14A400|nr:HAD family phosphatase [Draconibacterium sp. IB214405]MDX8340952.1 HAD family phosphatase [Draconibacterium sp. IB214405]